MGKHCPFWQVLLPPHALPSGATSTRQLQELQTATWQTATAMPAQSALLVQPQVASFPLSFWLSLVVLLVSLGLVSLVSLPGLLSVSTLVSVLVLMSVLAPVSPVLSAGL